jgi:hypothetical protein
LRAGGGAATTPAGTLVLNDGAAVVVVAAAAAAVAATAGYAGAAAAAAAADAGANCELGMTLGTNAAALGLNEPGTNEDALALSAVGAFLGASPSADMVGRMRW